MKNNIIKILRKNPTPWESKLWYHLRNRNLDRVKFRRQFKIDKYIVDFCCLEKKLIIELDGGHHNENDNIIRDQQRKKYLENHGYKVLRFWNNEVDNNLEGVIDKILENIN